MNESPFKRPESEDPQILISKFKTMDIEKLKAHIDDWEKMTDGSKQSQETLLIAKKELELKHNERQQQIELLTKSLTSSSRMGRWISSFKAVFIQFVESFK
tara:strand:+ start:119 stop:421 length:303 start_codon:yes stop_codon:yes gene_type:complete